LANSRRFPNCRRKKRRDVFNWSSDDSSAYSHDRSIRLALFLDDLQWLDAATLDLLEDLLTQTDLQHLLLIGAYRDNEVNATHPLVRKLDAIRQAGAAVEDIVLTPLGQDDLRPIAGGLPALRTGRAAPLAN
jgi:hypothetical protein